MPQQEPRKESPDERASREKGEHRLIMIVAVFVVVAIAGMFVIDHYGAIHMGNANPRNAADR